MKGQEFRSTSSCAACKFLKRRCTSNCIFAPYFRSDELAKFAKVHKVFGASNVSKILTEVPHEQRSDAVNSLVYEAEARLIDPVYGCLGTLALLQTKMTQLQHELSIARARLAHFTARTNQDVTFFPSSDFHFCDGIRSTHDNHDDMISAAPNSNTTSMEFQQPWSSFDVPIGTSSFPP